MPVRKGLLTLRANIVYYGTDSQLKAIEELKDKVKSSAKLETTEYKEIETKREIRKSWRSAQANVSTDANPQSICDAMR